jgi:outer membrane protein assembly factor BamA
MRNFREMKFRLFLCMALWPLLMYSAPGPLRLEVRENGTANVLRRYKIAETYANAAERDAALNKLLRSCWNDGFLAAGFDSLRQDSTMLRAWLNAGEAYRWAYLQKGNVDEEILNAAGFRERRWRNRPLRMAEAARLQSDILNWCENNGYPFAAVRLDSVQILPGQTIHARLSLDKSRFTRIDSIVVKGDLKLSAAYLHNYIGIAPGDAYNEQQLRAITARLRELPFLRETQTHTVLFTEKYTKLTLYLQKRRAGQFDGVAGFLPDSRTGQLVFTGDARLRLQNSFGRGELIDLQWRRLREQTQDLKARFTYPYLLRTPLGIDYTIRIYRRDTSFIDVNQNFGLLYMFSGAASLKAYVNRRNSSLLSTAAYENLTTLPPFADVNTTSWGLGFRREKLDYRLNPRRGWQMTLTADIGNRTIRQNGNLNPVVYQNLTLRTVQYSAELLLDKFWPLGRRSTIKTSVQAAWLQNETIFRNELYRIGGLRSLRGFDEESIFASSYGIGTVEFRYLLETNSFFFVFADGCWYENRSKDFATDTPVGFGTGVSFETKAGILSITYALGRQFGNPIQLRDGKIHIGIVSLF